MEYNIYHLQRMWNIYYSIVEWKSYSDEKIKLEKYSWTYLIYQTNRKIQNNYCKKNSKCEVLDFGEYLPENFSKELPEEFITIIRQYKVNLDAFLKPVKNKYSPEEFLKAFSCLKNHKNKEIIENLICLSNNEETQIKKNLALNLKIILDAFNISIAELDNSISAKDRIISKIINGKNKYLKDEGKIEEICKHLNELILSHIDSIEYDDWKFKDTLYINTSMNSIFDNNAIAFSKEFYIQNPISPNDLYYGRIKLASFYQKVDNNYYVEWLSGKYSSMSKAECNMIFNLIYEMIYTEYDLQRRNLIFKYKKKIQFLQSKILEKK